MTSKKQLLHDLLDIGGVATLNNLYSREAKTYKGSMRRLYEYKNFWLENGFIQAMKPYENYKPQNPGNELFYCLTKKGAAFIGRDDYDYKKAHKSPHLENIMHESAKFDVALAFIRLYRDWDVKIEYKTFTGLRPDIYITMNKNNTTLHFLVEIERKKDTSRVLREKVREQYQQKLKISETRNSLPRSFNVLIVYSSLTYNPFTRPQQMTGNIVKDIQDLRTETRELAKASNLPIAKFIALPDVFYLDKEVFYSDRGERGKIIN